MRGHTREVITDGDDDDDGKHRKGRGIVAAIGCNTECRGTERGDQGGDGRK